MVAARRDFEDFLIEQGFSQERAIYRASALERAAHAVTQEEFEAGLDRAIDKMTAIMREEFARRDADSSRRDSDLAELKTQVQHLVDQRREDLERGRAQRQEDLDRGRAQRQEDLERERANRRECRVLALAVGGTLIALLLRIFGAI